MTTLQASAQNQLRQLVEQIERLEEEKKALAADIRDKYLEAKAVGFDVTARSVKELVAKYETAVKARRTATLPGVATPAR